MKTVMAWHILLPFFLHSPVPSDIASPPCKSTCSDLSEDVAVAVTLTVKIDVSAWMQTAMKMSPDGKIDARFTMAGV